LHREDGITKGLKEFGPKPTGDGLVINALLNDSGIRFIVTPQLDKDSCIPLKGTENYLFNNHIYDHSGLSNSTNYLNI